MQAFFFQSGKKGIVSLVFEISRDFYFLKNKSIRRSSFSNSGAPIMGHGPWAAFVSDVDNGPQNQNNNIDIPSLLYQTEQIQC